MNFNTFSQDILSEEKKYITADVHKKSLRYARRLLGASEKTLYNFFLWSQSAKIQIWRSVYIAQFENFAVFLWKIKQLLELWNYKEFEKIIIIREKIQTKETLTQEDVDILQNHGLKHWRWADISRKVMQIIDGCDMRETNTHDIYVCHDVRHSVFSNTTKMRIEGDFIDNTVNESIVGINTWGYFSWNKAKNIACVYTQENFDFNVSEEDMIWNVSRKNFIWNISKKWKIMWNKSYGDFWFNTTKEI